MLPSGLLCARSVSCVCTPATASSSCAVMARYGCHAPLSTCRRRLRRCVWVFLAQALVFLNSKCLSLYKQKKKPGQLTWTQAWRRLNKKGKTITVTRRRNRKTTKFVRAVTGATKAEVRGCWGRVLGVSCTVCMLGCLYWGCSCSRAGYSTGARIRSTLAAAPRRPPRPAPPPRRSRTLCDECGWHTCVVCCGLRVVDVHVKGVRGCPASHRRHSPVFPPLLCCCCHWFYSAIKERRRKARAERRRAAKANNAGRRAAPAARNTGRRGR